MTNEAGRLSNIAFIGVGGCGVNMLESWLGMVPADTLCIAIDRDERDFRRKKKIKHKFTLLNVKCLNSTVEYSESVQAEVQASLDKQMSELTFMLRDHNYVVILAGLGGVVGSWASQVICNRFVAMDKQVTTVLVKPFGFESERVKVADYALPGFDGTAYRLLCINDYLLKHTPENTSFEGALDIMNEKAFELLGIPV